MHAPVRAPRAHRETAKHVMAQGIRTQVPGCVQLQRLGWGGQYIGNLCPNFSYLCIIWKLITLKLLKHPLIAILRLARFMRTRCREELGNKRCVREVRTYTLYIFANIPRTMISPFKSYIYETTNLIRFA